MADPAEKKDVPIWQLTVGQFEQLMGRLLAERMPAENTGAEYLTSKEAAQLLRISTRSLTNWVSEGMPCEWAGDHRRFRKADLLEWSRQRKKSRV